MYFVFLFRHLCIVTCDYADDSKLYRIISNPCDTETLQQDLNYISDWSKLWLLNFNTTKCSVMHLGRNNKATKHIVQPNHQLKYLTSTHLRTKTSRSVDHTIYDLQCALSLISQQSNRALGVIKCNFKYISESSLIIFFVRPDNHIWSTVPQSGIRTIVRTSTYLKRCREEPLSLFHLSLHSVMNPD